MQKDVFLSYSTDDSLIAGRVCEFLEGRGIACWIAPRDVMPGAEFDEAILDAIDQTQAIVVILSKNANASPFVKNEVNRAFAKGKTIFTFRIEEIFPAGALEFYLARHHWTDGFPPPLEEKVARLAAAIAALVGKQLPTIPSDLQAQSGRARSLRSSTPILAGELPDEVEDEIDSAEVYESIGDVWSATKDLGEQDINGADKDELITVACSPKVVGKGIRQDRLLTAFREVLKTFSYSKIAIFSVQFEYYYSPPTPGGVTSGDRGWEPYIGLHHIQSGSEGETTISENYSIESENVWEKGEITVVGKYHGYALHAHLPVGSSLELRAVKVRLVT